MARKGVFENASLIIVTFILGIAIAGMGIEKIVSLEDVVTKAMLPVLGARIENTIYMLGALERAEVEMELTENHRLKDKSGNVLIKYTLDDEKVLNQEPAKYQLNPRNEIRTPELDNEREKKASKLCIQKKPDKTVSLKAGGCG